MAADRIDQTIDTVFHPLESLTREEIKAAATIVREEMAELGETLRFEMIELDEPPKADWSAPSRPAIPSTGKRGSICSVQETSASGA